MLALLRYAYQLVPRTLAFAVCARVIVAGLTVAAPILVGQSIGRLPGVLTAGVDAGFVTVLAALLVVLVLQNVMSLVGETVSTRIVNAVDTDVTLRMGHALSSQPGLATVDDPDVTSRLQKVRGRRWEIEAAVRQAQGPAVASVLGLVGGAVALGITVAWWLPLPLVAAWVAATARLSRFIASQMDVWSGQTEPQKHAWYAFQQGMGKSAKEIRIFGLAPYLRQRHWDSMTAAFEPYWKRRRTMALANAAMDGGRVAVTIGALAYVGWRASRGQLGLTQVATGMPLILTLGQADTWMFGLVGRGRVVLSWLDDLARAGAGELSIAADSEHRHRSIMPEQAPRRRSRAVLRPRDVPAPAVAHDTTSAPTIVFDDVTFRYPTGGSPIVDGLTMTLPGGKAAALVGVNGAGKSTLVKLLAGGYRPQRGRILVDGVDLGSLDETELASWQRRVAPITQDFIRLPLPAGDNVELGAGRVWAGRVDLDTWPGAAGLSAAVLDATADRAGIGDLLAKLPEGWRTPLDKTIPGGRDLSGGEWQRIGLARALRAVAAGAQVLVLDEPAAALDVEAESRLVDGYLDLAEHVTSLVISHRFSVVRPVPLIYVLEDGHIVEAGGHDELMAAGGRYRTMFTLQASRYAAAEVAAGGDLGAPA